MDQKRFLAFIVLSASILIGWNAFVMPRLKPPVDHKALAQAKAKIQLEEARRRADQEKEKGEGTPAEVGDAALADGQPAPQQAEQPAAVPIVVEFKEQTVLLGSDRFETDFRQLVTLTSRGAAVKRIELNDPRYKALHKPHPPLEVVGADAVRPLSLSMKVPQIDAKADLSEVPWELIEVQPAEGPHKSATFRLRVGDLQVTRRYELGVCEHKGADVAEAPAYLLAVELKFENLGAKPQTINYELQGPTGVPLENVDNTQKFRDVVAGFVGSSKNELLAAKTIAEAKGEKWTAPFDYLGVDAQYFAALLMPTENQSEKKYVRSVTQELLGPPLAERSEIGVVVTSVDLDLEKAGDKDGHDAATHKYELFAGPKRDDVLPPGTARIVDYGWFGVISRPMLALLKSFHWITGSWGIAIICLTIVVRGAMFPISIQQARGAAKMQEIQPQIAALKEKYGNDKEKMMRAQMELFRKHNYNPAKGCLPLFLQLPIFMGLYQALNHAVDLRMAKFLWVQNLAAPDALFQLPFIVPFFGWKEFNLLPLITTGLFLVQQKMFMPPPTNDEQAMQQKMMNFMTVFMGVMFYKVPAGLCVYFIASSLWGMGERKLLPKAKAGVVPPAGDERSAGGDESPRGPRRGPAKPNGDGEGDSDEPEGFFARILRAAEKETSARKASQRRK